MPDVAICSLFVIPLAGIQSPASSGAMCEHFFSVRLPRSLQSLAMTSDARNDSTQHPYDSHCPASSCTVDSSRRRRSRSLLVSRRLRCTSLPMVPTRVLIIASLCRSRSV